MRNGWWSIVVGGLVGALLYAGPVGAQPFTGGLPECVRQLNTCNANLGTCETDRAACQAEPNVIFPGDGVDGPALSYHDNGDGTFTDNNTLLMWEMKVDGGSAGCPTDSANLHGYLSTCTWAQATGAWIAAINAANLGGHNDWRLPNVRELQSIMDYGQLPVPGSPQASFLPDVTAAAPYWSSTSLALNPFFAWGVDFGNVRVSSRDFLSFGYGSVSLGDKDVALRVRVVRGGR